VTITAIAGNQPPVVSAGPNQTTTLPTNTVSLNGVATDDGLPNGTLTITWSQVLGPAGVVFSNPNQAVTQATFPGVGTYVLQLTATDSQLQSVSDVTITVNPQSGNQPPVVNAGPDQTVTLPANAVTLNGTATDDGLPNGTLLTSWTQVGGNVPATISNPTKLSTVVTFPQAGIYVLQLSASDTQLSSSSTVNVVVNPPSRAGSLLLSPANAGPDVVTATQTLIALLQDGNGNPIPGATVTFVVTGANAVSGASTTGNDGVASFTYTGLNAGTDTVQANASPAGVPLLSNLGTVSWIVPAQPVSASTVLGRFYISDGAESFDIQPNAQPVFTQTFSNMAFNADMNYSIGPKIPGGTGTAGYFTAPFTNVVIDGNGNFAGNTVAEGNGYVTGQYPLNVFQAVFTGQLTVAGPGMMTFNVYSDDGFQFGIGGGATRVSGIYYNAPASGVTAFNSYPIMGAYNVGGWASARTFIVQFPAAGNYPFEADYSECCGWPAAFVVSYTTTTESVVGPAGSLILTPASVPSASTGVPQTLTLTATDGSGSPVAELPVTLTITGNDPQQLVSTTDLGGHAQFAWTGANSGTDVAQAQARISGSLLTSNQVNVARSQYPLPPVVNAGQSQIITLPVNSVTLNGSATEPLYGGPVATSWTQVSGPGAVSFGTPNQPITQATFSSAGTYVLQLTGTFSIQVNGVYTSFTSSSNVTITVATPQNQPPTVSIGSPQTVSLPQNSVVLSGSATAQNNDPLAISWSEVNGPGTMSFSAANALYTIAGFSATGTYVVRLTATDTKTQLAGWADVTITVNSNNHNQAPVVSAGPNQSITLPISTLTIYGSVQDDGQPNGTRS